MSNEIIDISTLSNITSNFSNLSSESKLNSHYSVYSLYLENRNDDVPEQYQTNLYGLFNDGIDNLFKEGISSITIGEQVTTNANFLCLQNYELITKSQFSAVDDVIEYDKINDFSTELIKAYSTDTPEEISGKILDWFTKIVGMDFEINKNPEDADDSNLILTNNLKPKIQSITESVLNKFYRNLIQLIRVIHDYRLYGKGSTVLGGRNYMINSYSNQAWAGLPNSCWTEYSGNYIVGKSAYTENINEADGNGTIKNSSYNISPYTTYGVAPHTHEVTVDISELPKSKNIEKEIWINLVQESGKYAAMIDEGDATVSHGYKSWRDCAQDGLNAAGTFLKMKGLYASKGQPADVIASSNWSYSWKSNEYCKLMSPSAALENIYTNDNVVLPTYSSYVWKWTGKDSTSIYQLI